MECRNPQSCLGIPSHTWRHLSASGRHGDGMVWGEEWRTDRRRKCVATVFICYPYYLHINYIVFTIYHDIILPEHPQTLDSRQLVKKRLGEIHPRCFTEHSTADSFLMNFLGNMIPKAFVVNVIPARCVLQMI